MKFGAWLHRSWSKLPFFQWLIWSWKFGFYVWVIAVLSRVDIINRKIINTPKTEYSLARNESMQCLQYFFLSVLMMIFRLCLDPKFGSKLQSFSITSTCHTHTTFQSHHLQFQLKSKLWIQLNTALMYLNVHHQWPYFFSSIVYIDVHHQ